MAEILVSDSCDHHLPRLTGRQWAESVEWRHCGPIPGRRLMQKAKNRIPPIACRFLVNRLYLQARENLT